MRVEVNKDPRLGHISTKDLLQTPVVVRVNKFNEEAAKVFHEKVNEAHNTGQPVIPVVIDSYGGQVYSLLSMLSVIESSELPVATIGLGKCMSCGAVLLGMGTPGYRYVAPGTTVMIHDVSNMSIGKSSEIQATAKETDRLKKELFHRLATSCKKDKNYFIEELRKRDNAEWYITAAQAKKINLVDCVATPTLSVNIEVSMDFG